MALPKNHLADLSQNARDWAPQNESHPVSLVSGSVAIRVFAFVLITLILVAAFNRPLWSLLKFAAHSDLYSHILLIPFLSLYLAWLKRHKLALDSKARPALAIIPFAIGLAILAGFYFSQRRASPLDSGTFLATMTFAWLTFVWGGCFLFFGSVTIRVIAFPLLLLFFAVPFPTYVLDALQTFLQTGSASVARLLFQISGTPVLQQGMLFQLPGFALEVAPECSGIHSSLVLFIISFPAGHLLLRGLWTKALLVLFVVPLAMIRNGIRIFTIGQLCIHISPDMIHSYIHRHGGPLFFVLSLAPFFLLLLILMRIESKTKRQ